MTRSVCWLNDGSGFSVSAVPEGPTHRESQGESCPQLRKGSLGNHKSSPRLAASYSLVVQNIVSLIEKLPTWVEHIG